MDTPWKVVLWLSTKPTSRPDRVAGAVAVADVAPAAAGVVATVVAVAAAATAVVVVAAVVVAAVPTAVAAVAD